MLKMNFLPLVKDLVYSQYFDESSDINRLNALLKFDRVVLETMADALEAKPAPNYNPYLVVNLFKWYSTYVRSYNVLFEAGNLVIVTEQEKKVIQEIIDNINENEDDVDSIMQKLDVALDKIKDNTETVYLTGSNINENKAKSSISKAGKSKKENIKVHASDKK